MKKTGSAGVEQKPVFYDSKTIKSAKKMTDCPRIIKIG